MKYDVEKLVRTMLENCQAIEGEVSIIELFLSRTISTLGKIEEIETVLETPKRKDKDIAKHIKLVKDLHMFYEELLNTVGTMHFTANIMTELLNTEYNKLFEAIKL